MPLDRKHDVPLGRTAKALVSILHREVVGVLSTDRNSGAREIKLRCMFLTRKYHLDKQGVRCVFHKRKGENIF